MPPKPIRWTPELEQIIMRGVFAECNITFSKELVEKLANEVSVAIGSECKPKSVKNYLYAWKKKNMTGSSGPDGSATNTPTKATPKKAASTPKTPRSRVIKSTPNKRKASSEESGDGSEGATDNGEDIISPSAAAGKRGKRASYTEPESEDDGLGGPVEKLVKAELVDDDDYSIFGD